MKFSSILLAATSLVASVSAAPTATQALSIGPQITDTISALANLSPTVNGTIECTTGSGVCSVTCGDDLQSVCSIIGAVDSVLYGIEVLAGFQIQCQDNGCVVTCPTKGTVVCVLDQAGTTIDSVVVVAENIIIHGVEDLLKLVSGKADLSEYALSESTLGKLFSGLGNILATIFTN